jgi:hypothetical protein
VASGATTLNGIKYFWPSSDGTSGQVLTTNSAGYLTWETASGGGSLDDAYNSGATIAVDAYDILFDLDDSTNDYGLVIDNNTAGLIDIGLEFTSGGTGAFTDAIDASANEIVNAIDVGANIISGTGAVIDFTNFDVDPNGAISGGNITPKTTSAYELGTSSLRWDGLYVGSVNASGAVSGVTTLASSGDWTWTATSPTITVNSTEIFAVTDGTETFDVDFNANDFTFGDGTNNFIFDINTGPDYNGTARPTKTVILVPEYPGATLEADTSNNTGTMTSGFCSEDQAIRSAATPTAASPCDSDNEDEEHNFYTWTTAQASAQDYDIWVRWPLPQDFDDFPTSAAVQAYGWRTDSTDEAVTVTMFDTAGVSDASTNVATGTAAWTTTTVEDDPTGTYTQGDYVTFRVNVAAGQNDTVHAGEIEIDYYARF